MITEKSISQNEQVYQIMHIEMLSCISLCMQQNLPEIQRIESCFWIALEYWKRIKKIISENKFSDEADEINFFRNVKPMFTSYIEYFIILVEAAMFVPNERDECMLYWKSEATRFERFCSKNREFISYYESDCHYLDSHYFSRTGITFKQLPKTPVYDIDNNFRTSHDHLIRSLLANKMYYEYVRKKIQELSKEN
jgi:hypothetical protein